MESFSITKVGINTRVAAEEFLAGEVPLTIMVNDKELVTLLCTPQDIEDLTRGFLFTSGLIRGRGDIKKIVVNTEQWVAYAALASDSGMDNLVFKRLYTSGCGRGTIFYNALDFMHRQPINSSHSIKKTYVDGLMAVFQKKSQMFFKTGCVHSAAIADDKGIVVFREDIGRHNAIDKVIGHMIHENGSLEDRVIITSGRISSEVLFKVQKAKVPIVISRSAPTNQAVKLARDMGITLIGFARGNRMNIYSGEQRITID